MKTLILTISLIASLIFNPLLFAQNIETDSIQGSWKNSDRPIEVTISKVGDLYQGYITNLDTQNVKSRIKESNTSVNPDFKKKLEERKNKIKPTSSMHLFKDLKYIDAEKIWSGQVYVNKRGQYMDTVLTMENPDSFTMSVSMGLFDKQIKWSRK